MKVIGSRSKSQGQKREIAYFHNVYKTSIGNDSGSIEDRPVKFTCSIGLGFGYGGSNGMTAIFVTRPEVTTSN